MNIKTQTEQISIPVSLYQELLADRARLDYLESCGNGSYWVTHKSKTSKGYQIHNTTGYYGMQKTVREAIDWDMRT